MHHCKSNLEFENTYHMLLEVKQVLDFHLDGALLCQVGNLCVPSSKCAKMIWEENYSRVAGNFGVEKMVVVLQKYLYWQNL